MVAFSAGRGKMEGQTIEPLFIMMRQLFTLPSMERSTVMAISGSWELSGGVSSSLTRADKEPHVYKISELNPREDNAIGQGACF